MFRNHKVLRVTAKTRAMSAFHAAKAAVVYAGSAVGSLVASGAAMAQTVPSSDFDPAPIIAKVAEYGGYAVLIITALIGIRWALRALGVLK